MESAMPRKEQEFIEHIPQGYIREPNSFIMDLIDTPVFSKNEVNVTASADTTAAGFSDKDALPPELHFHNSIFHFVNKADHSEPTSSHLEQTALTISSDEASGLGHNKHSSDFMTLNNELFSSTDNKTFCASVAVNSDNIQQFPTLSLLEVPNEALQEAGVLQNGDLVYTRSSASIARKILPHKKRISSKLKVDQNETDKLAETFDKLPTEETVNAESLQFSCELCKFFTSSQLQFFEHLKQHYEPNTTPLLDAIKIPSETPIVSVNTNVDQVFLNIADFPTVDATIRHAIDRNQVNDMNILNSNNIEKCINFGSQAETTSVKHISTDEVEFSDTEDMLEGIRNVVDKVSIEDTCDDIDLIEPNCIRPVSWFTNDSFCDITFRTKQLEDVPVSESLVQLSPSASIDSKSNNSLKMREPETFSLFADVHGMEKSSIVETDEQAQFELGNDRKKRTTRNGDISESCQEETKHFHPKEINENQKGIDVIDNSIHKDLNELVTEEFKRRFLCTMCNRYFNSSNALKYHHRTHSGLRSHQCDLCGRRFFAQGALKSHLHTHTGDKPFECEHCLRKFRQWGDLKYHVISIHTDEKNHQCEFCGKSFSRKYSLVLHRRIHTSERNYKCEYCEKTFRASTYLQNHRKIHTGEKPHKCDVCGKCFRVSGDLRRHIRIHDRKLKVKGEAHEVMKLITQEKLNVQYENDN